MGDSSLANLGPCPMGSVVRPSLPSRPFLPLPISPSPFQSFSTSFSNPFLPIRPGAEDRGPVCNQAIRCALSLTLDPCSTPLGKYKKTWVDSLDHRQKGWNSRWRPRWPPYHKIIHNSSRKCVREIILVSLHRLWGSRNLMKSCIWSSPYLVMVKSNMASCMTLVQRRGPLLWWTFSISNAKINRKRLQIAEISFPVRKSELKNWIPVSKCSLETHKYLFLHMHSEI